ncbi:MAG: hypothetical protein WC136_01385 [Sphaerochaeta sp.]|jgi:hypothetical protein
MKTKNRKSVLRVIELNSRIHTDQVMQELYNEILCDNDLPGIFQDILPFTNSKIFKEQCISTVQFIPLVKFRKIKIKK